MEIWTGIIIPILSSIIGGLLGGLFTFLGIKITLKNEKIEKNEEKRLKTIEENLQIIKQRPILELTNENKNINMDCKAYFLPIENYTLTSPKDIEYDFSTNYGNKEVWDKYSLFLKNTGNKKITRAFITIENNNVLLYGESDIYNWNQFKHYYRNMTFCQGDLDQNSILKMDIHYPKNHSFLKDLVFSIYFEDENGNYWKQFFIGNNYVDKILYVGVSPKEYESYIRQQMYEFYTYHRAFFDNKRKISFKYNSSDMLKILDEDLMKWNKQYQEFESFKYDYENGFVALKKDFSQF